MTYAKTRLLVITAASAVMGVTAIAFASDMIVRRDTAPISAFTVSSTDGDACEANTCSIVVKAEGPGASSEVINLR